MCSTLFLYISLPLFCTTTTRNFQKIPGYTFYGGNVVRVLVVAGGRLHFLFAHRRYKISCCSSNKKCILCFFYLAQALFLVELRWPVALLSRLLCISLSLSLSLFSKILDMTINLNLTLQTTGYKNIFRFPFLTL